MNLQTLKSDEKNEWKVSPFHEREKIHTRIFEKASEASKAIASEIAKWIINKQELGEKCVLGLATGSSPKTVYAELIRLHKEEGLSFKNVVTFNLPPFFVRGTIEKSVQP